MKKATLALLITLNLSHSALCELPPLPAYALLQTQDISYGNTKRVAYRIHLDTATAPSPQQMKETAATLWVENRCIPNTTRAWDECTVFMIFGEMEDFAYGAYGIAEFTPDGLASFKVNKTPLQMLELNQ